MDSCSCTKGTLTLAGDILIRKSSPAHEALVHEAFNTSAVFGTLFPRISQSDIFFFNFESTLSENAQPRDSYLPSHFYINSGPELLPFLQNLNPNSVCSLANNHIGDYGKDAMVETRSSLERSGLKTVGVGIKADLSHPLVLTSKDTRITFLAFTDLLPVSYFAGETPGAYQLTAENLMRGIDAARRVADIVVVSLHTVANISDPFSEAPDHAQERFGLLAAQEGAHLVVGHQPHGIQHVARKEGALIFHSLGALVYNPKASSLYKEGQRFYNGTQFYGGSLLRVNYCVHGIEIVEWLPTICKFEGEVLRVREGTFLNKLKARSFLLLK